MDNIVRRKVVRSCHSSVGSMPLRGPRHVRRGAWRASQSGIVQRPGRHALNVEIEVRILVPELYGRVAQSRRVLVSQTRGCLFESSLAHSLAVEVTTKAQGGNMQRKLATT